MPSLIERSLPSWFSAFDCSPADRLTPRESLMTMRERNNDTIKRFENPSVSTTAVLIDTATAEWLDGIPPVLQKKMSIASRKASLCALTREITALMNCAMRRLNNAERNIGLLNSV